MSRKVNALKVHALFEDELNGELSNETLVDAMDEIFEARHILEN